ncbi:unnamed protein product [Toxocara canis]|uniref:Transmembrane protein n=1 Tax=Toxocara canis TaxID=6265 RepID=A0A183UNM1_TOXCA|nr:unnamed protein product [Toxocara canis]
MAQLSAVQERLDMAHTLMVITIYPRLSRRSKAIMICMTIASACLRLLSIISEGCFCFVSECATKINAILLVRIDRWINAISAIACALATIAVVVVVSKTES